MATGATAVATTLATITMATTMDTSSTLSTRGPHKFQGYGFSGEGYRLMGVSRPRQLGLSQAYMEVERFRWEV